MLPCFTTREIWVSLSATEGLAQAGTPYKLHASLGASQPMSLISILSSAQGGHFFANAGKAAGVDPGIAERALVHMCPDIAARLRDKAEADHDAFENLLDLLEDGGNSADLDDASAMTNAEAVADGKAVLKDLYGADISALQQLAPGVEGPAFEKLSAIGATSVLASLAKTYAAPQALAGDSGGASSGGLFGAILSAVVAGAVQGAVRQLAPKRRRRRSYGSYYAPKRRTRRKRARTPSLNDIFGSILGRR
jgi:hypothetical protein